MSTIAVTRTASSVPARAKVAAGVALPLGVMNIAGAIVFWEWSWLSWVSVWAAAMGAATLAGAVMTLAGRAGGLRVLHAAIVSQLVFTAMKLVFWQELEALPFGVGALVLLALVRGRRA